MGIDISHDGTLLASGSADGAIYVYDWSVRDPRVPTSSNAIQCVN